MSQVGTVILTGVNADTQLDGVCQVVLYNDDVNTLEHVVHCLQDVFGHGETMSVKLAMDAHESGRTIAQVEGRTEATHHKEQLVSYGLTAEVERL